MRMPMRAATVGVVLCRTCGRMLPRVLLDKPLRCTRCASLVLARAPRSAGKTLAWLLAGMILYVPAIVLPVLHTRGMGGEQDNTILDGVQSFWRAGSWGIASLIFIASVMVPLTKFLGLSFLVWTVSHHSDRARAQRSRLYRLLESIGYWSMLDVVVVALTTVLLQFTDWGTAEPRLGIVFFCGVVVTTMISALSFDPRLIWDGGLAND